MKTTQCQQCSKTFRIEDRDFEFYQWIKVPAPTLCPECRAQRRLMWRNERFLYERACDLCNQSIIATYPAESPYTVYCQACWWSDKWDPRSFGRAIDFKQPFFPQFNDLLQAVPRVNLVASNNENSPYVNYTNYSKDCHLINGGHTAQRCLYGWRVVDSRDCVDVLQINHSELCYFVSDVTQSYNVNFSSQVSGSRDCAFVYDCKTSHDCFLSSNLRNASYIFRNKQLTEAEYKRAVAKYDLGSYLVQQTLWQEYQELLIRQTVHRSMQTLNAQNSLGNNLTNVEQCQHCYNVLKAQNLAYSYYCEDLKDSYDATFCGWPAESIYDSLSAAVKSNNIQFSVVCWSSYNVAYSDNCHNVHDIFGSTGLRKAQYCILNQTYDPATYERTRLKLIEHMKTTGEYGEFFPASCAPYAYNETLGNDLYPVTAEQAKANSWKWLDNQVQKITQQTVVVPDQVTSVLPSIVHTTFQCVGCARPFRYVTAEINYHQQTGLALSPYCSGCRFTQLMSLRTPMMVWQRQCMCTQTDHGHAGRCGKEFATTYSPERKEIVYCEHCYAKEIN